MACPETLNTRIAFSKEWTYGEELHISSREMGYMPTHWCNPEGTPATRPDFTGTLEGVAGMMSNLNSRAGECWVWMVDAEGETGTQYMQENPAHCFRIDSSAPLHGPRFDSPADRPGDCVGEAWMSVFRKEA